ncbi:MAG: response regulator transcription factor [Ignavibacteriaceae bacterium]
MICHNILLFDNKIIISFKFLIRQGLKSVLTGNSVKITGEIKNSSEFLSKIHELKPDILILGANYEKMITDSELSQVQYSSPDTRILIISDCKENGKLLNAIKSGATGYLTEECNGEEILNAVYSVSKGEKFFCNKILDVILEKKLDNETSENAKDNLTEREIEIIKLITDKYTNPEIAEKLFISIHTVYTHRKNIMRKLRLKSPVELILYAIDSGIIQPYQN